MRLDHHTLAAVGLAGNALNLLGALYLAYDLFGGEHGPLRTLTRSVTYGVLFFLGYVSVLPVVFSILAAAGNGVSVGVELARAARGRRSTFAVAVGASALRSLCYGVGCAWLFEWRFGLAFALLTIPGQLFAYRMGFRPTNVIEPDRHIGKQLLGVVNRTVGYATAGLLSGLLIHMPRRDALLFGLGMGVAVGGISAIMGFICPVVEAWADRLPLRRLGMFGVFLLGCGFLLASFQNWVTLLTRPTPGAMLTDDIEHRYW